MPAVVPLPPRSERGIQIRNADEVEIRRESAKLSQATQHTYTANSSEVVTSQYFAISSQPITIISIFTMKHNSAATAETGVIWINMVLG